MFPFFKIPQENQSPKKYYEDYFIDKFKLLLNKKRLKSRKLLKWPFLIPET